MLRFLIASIFFIFPSIYCMVKSVEFWPFTHYPMYSQKRESPFKSYRIYGIDNENQTQMLVTYKSLYPLLRHHVDQKFSALIAQNKKSEIDIILKYYLRRNVKFRKIELRQDTSRIDPKDGLIIEDSQTLQEYQEP